MSRRMALCLLLGLAAGCERGSGYARPADRNIGAIGAPQVTVGTGGLAHGNPGRGSVQDLRHDMAPFTGGTTSASAEPVDVVPLASQQRIESGQIAKVQAHSLTIDTASGEALHLKLGSMTSIRLDGKPASLKSLPEGADVRASFTETGDEQMADHLEVRSNAHSKKVTE